MKDLNDEIKLTLNLMQTDIDDGAHSELQSHLYSLLEMKRAKLQKGLGERSWIDDQSPYKSGPIIGRAEPLTTEELKAGGWWCADISKGCADALESKGLSVFYPTGWGDNGSWSGCTLDDDDDVIRVFYVFEGIKQIHRNGSDFYWTEK